MPVTKVPIVHKFGIISHSQRLALQERLLKQSYYQTFGSRKVDGVTQRKPLEVTDEFVFQYNNAQTEAQKVSLEFKAGQMRAGLQGAGKGKHVDLPLAWTELTQLIQCKGVIEEQALDALLISVDQAPFNRSQLPTMFFLAESTLYMLRTDCLKQPYLRKEEIKLLLVGRTVFTRLFYHHMSGHLQGQLEFKSRLFTYLHGFCDSQDAYIGYPNSLLCMRYMHEVGKMIIGDSSSIDAGEVKEGDNIKVHSKIARLKNWDSKSDTTNVTSHSSELFRDVSARIEEGQSSHSGAISSSVHDLSPTLWHSLDVWRCVRGAGGGLDDALLALARCAQSLSLESWVDAVVAMMILADAAKHSLETLIVLQQLAQGILVETGPEPGTSRIAPAQHSFETKLESQRSLVGKEPTDVSRINTKDSKWSATDRWLRKHVQPSDGDQSELSDAATATNKSEEYIPGVNGWHWEVALIYTEVMTDICLYGTTSAIQKRALQGSNIDLGNLHKVAREPCCPLFSAGLLDMLHFIAVSPTTEKGASDWSWRLRYAAIHGLMKLCRCPATPVNEGLKNVAWAAIKSANSVEKDSRVLEALRVGQVQSSQEKQPVLAIAVSPTTIGARLATGLSRLYLPPLPPPVQIAKKPERTPVKLPTYEPVKSSRPADLAPKPVVKDKLGKVPSFNTRTIGELHSVVGDQWGKQLKEEEAEEEEERLKLEEEKEKEEEERQKEIYERRKLKLNKSYPGMPYTVPSDIVQRTETVSIT